MSIPSELRSRRVKFGHESAKIRADWEGTMKNYFEENKPQTEEEAEKTVEEIRKMMDAMVQKIAEARIKYQLPGQ